jgi:hypothetical protein
VTQREQSQATSRRERSGSAHFGRMGKDLPAIPSVLSGLHRKGDMLGKSTNLKFMDQDIIDEQTVLELAMDQYSCAEHIPKAGNHTFST